MCLIWGVNFGTPNFETVLTSEDIGSTRAALEKCSTKHKTLSNKSAFRLNVLRLLGPLLLPHVDPAAEYRIVSLRGDNARARFLLKYNLKHVRNQSRLMDSASGVNNHNSCV